MLFGTSGIRGIYDKDITEELAYRIANVFAASSIRQEVVIGKDTRKSCEVLEYACADGVLAAGKNAMLLGIVPTPVVSLATVKRNCNGIMITASHNPGEYNGFKLFRNGKEISHAEEGEFERSFNEWEGKSDGSKGKTENLHLLETHRSMIKNLVDCNAIAGKKPNVVVDCNGAAGVIAPHLLREMGCHVISMNAELEGFNRPSEPNAENLSRTAEIVKATGADLGIAHDGDGDRCVVIDETGTVLPLDVQLAMMIEYELQNAENRKIITTTEASLVVRETCKRLGAEMRITPVSSVYVSEELEKNNAWFGGEPCGEYIFSRAAHHAPDGILAAAIFVEMFAEKGALSVLKKSYGQYPMLREKFECKNKPEAIRKVTSHVTIEGKRNEEDGLRIDEEDGWFLIRASGTEPIIRLTMEYKNGKKLGRRAAELRRIIMSSLK